MKTLESRKARFVEHQAEIHCAKYGLSVKEHLFTGGMVGDPRIYFTFVLTVTVAVSRLQTMCICEMWKNINVLS